MPHRGPHRNLQDRFLGTNGIRPTRDHKAGPFHELAQVRACNRQREADLTHNLLFSAVRMNKKESARRRRRRKKQIKKKYAHAQLSICPRAQPMQQEVDDTVGWQRREGSYIHDWSLEGAERR